LEDAVPSPRTDEWIVKTVGPVMPPAIGIIANADVRSSIVRLMPLIMIIVLMMSLMTMMIAIDEVVRFQQIQVDANALPHNRH
jgi:hypothetical protein